MEGGGNMRFETGIFKRPEFENMKFHGQDVLVPSAQGEPVREGTGMPQSHLDIALKLQTFRDRNKPEAFSRLLRIREARMRSEQEAFDREILAVENALGSRFI